MVKNNQDNQIQNITLLNMYFFGKKDGAFSRISVLKVILHSVRLLLTVSYRKKLGMQDVLLAPQ